MCDEFEKTNVFNDDQTVCFSEIGKVRGNLFQINGKKNDPLVLPDGVGPPATLSEKVYVPIKEYPEVTNSLFNISLETHIPHSKHEMMTQ